MYIRKIDYAATPVPLQELCVARRSLLSAVQDWLCIPPGQPAVRDEVDATVSAIRQIASLNGALP